MIEKCNPNQQNKSNSHTIPDPLIYVVSQMPSTNWDIILVKEIESINNILTFYNNFFLQ